MLPKTPDRQGAGGLPAKPRDCAIAVCVPLEVDTFLRALTEGEPGTFVRENMQESERWLSPLQRWEKYRPLTTLVERVLQHVERRGVHVVRNACLAQFLELCTAYPNVTLVAHWRSARFRETDVADAAALERLLGSPTAFQGRVRELAGDTPWEVNGVDLLNRALQCGMETWPENAVAGTLSRKQAAWHERRLQLEAAAPGEFRGGAAVEFHDGLHTVAHILSALPERMPPLLDLTICNSVLLAQTIHQARPGTHCLCSERQADLPVRIAIYRQVIDLLHRRQTTFLDACFDVRRYLKEGTA